MSKYSVALKRCLFVKCYKVCIVGLMMMSWTWALLGISRICLTLQAMSSASSAAMLWYMASEAAWDSKETAWNSVSTKPGLICAMRMLLFHALICKKFQFLNTIDARVQMSDIIPPASIPQAKLSQHISWLHKNGPFPVEAPCGHRCC